MVTAVVFPEHLQCFFKRYFLYHQNSIRKKLCKVLFSHVEESLLCSVFQQRTLSGAGTCGGMMFCCRQQRASSQLGQFRLCCLTAFSQLSVLLFPWVYCRGKISVPKLWKWYPLAITAAKFTVKQFLIVECSFLGCYWCQSNQEARSKRGKRPERAWSHGNKQENSARVTLSSERDQHPPLLPCSFISGCRTLKRQ